MPSFYVVPRATVAKQVREDHEKWQPTHGPSTIPKFTDHDGVYTDRWDLLGLTGIGGALDETATMSNLSHTRAVTERGRL